MSRRRRLPKWVPVVWWAAFTLMGLSIISVLRSDAELKRIHALREAQQAQRCATTPGDEHP